MPGQERRGEKGALLQLPWKWGMKDPRKEKVKLGMHAGKHMGSAALGWGAAGEAEWGEVLRESKGFWFGWGLVFCLGFF